MAHAEGEVTGPLLDRFNAAIDSMEIDGPHSNNDGDGQEDDESDGEEKGAESEHEGSEGRIARSIFGSIHDRNLPRPTSDTAYSILATLCRSDRTGAASSAGEASATYATCSGERL